MPAAYYALHELTAKSHPVPTEMMLAIARRESEFDPVRKLPPAKRNRGLAVIVNFDELTVELVIWLVVDLVDDDRIGCRQRRSAGCQPA